MTEELLVILPTYNERQNILPLIDCVQTSLPDSHILVVDANSPDDTGDIVVRKSEQDPSVQCLHCSKNEGLGGAYIAGFRWALDRNYSHIFQMDADFSHDPAVLPNLLEATQTHDIALGSRWIRGAGVVGWPYHRRILSKTANLYARKSINSNIRDLTGGYKCFRRNVLETINLSQITSSGYGFQIEITWCAMKYGFTVVEVPIIFSDRTAGKSKLSAATIFEAFGLVVRLRRATVLKRYDSQGTL